MMRSTPQIALREVQTEDIAIFFRHQSDKLAVDLAGIPCRDWEAHAVHWQTILADPTYLVRTIVYEGEVAGQVLTFNRTGLQEVGYWLGTEFWGKGIATAALNEFLPSISIRPLFAHTAKQNAGSIRTLEKCGFKEVGSFEGFQTADGTPIEGVRMKLER